MAVAGSNTRLLAMGTRPVTALVLVSAAHAVAHAYAALMPLIYALVLSEFRIGPAEIGLMVGVAGVASGLLQFVFGVLGQYVPRRFLIGLGNIGLGIATMLTGAAVNFGQFFAGNVAARVATAPQHPIGTSLLSDRFGKAGRGAAIAVHVAGGNLGTVGIPILAAIFLAGGDWRTALMVFGISGLVFGTANILFVDDHRPVLETDGKPGKSAIPSPGEWFTPLRDRQVLLVILASVIAAGGRGLGIILVIIPLYFKDINLAPSTSSAMYTVLLVGSVIGPLLAGWLSDRFGRKPVTVGAYVTAAIFTMLLVAAGTSLVGIAVMAVLMGLSVYGQGSLLQALLADVAVPRLRDVTFGLFFTLGYGVGSLWAVAVGFAAAAYGYPVAFAIIAVTYLGAALCLLPVSGQREAAHAADA